VASLANGAFTNDTTPVIKGTAAADAVSVIIEIDGQRYTVPVTNGNWSFEIPAELADKQYVINAIAVDAAGNESVASADFVLNIDTSAPAELTVESPGNISSAQHYLGVDVKGTAEANS